MTIKEVKATEVLDSRGIPTIRVDLKTNKGTFTAITPSGTSSGKYEAFELRDNNPFRYSGKGVRKAVNNINKIIAKEIKNQQPNLKQIDQILIELDHTYNKSNLGANAILPVSIAVCRAEAKHHNLPLYKHIQKLSKTKNLTLPIPQLLVLEGGRHATNSSDFQEFMISIKAKTFQQSLEQSTLIYKTIKKLLTKNKQPITVGMEGAFPSPFKDNEQPFKLIEQAAKITKTKAKLKIAIDVAASEFYKKNLYHLNSEKKHLTFQKLSKYYQHLINKYPIYSIEDPFDQDDWAAWKSLTKLTKKQKTMIVADDLTTTNPTRIQQAIKRKACNTLLVKPNQIGTITETLQAIKLAKKAKFNIIISHRSGDTSDPFIADLAVGTAAKFIKTGAPSRSERLVKYNRLLKIEQELGKKVVFQGKDF